MKRDRPLGSIQRQVLRTLANRGASAATDWSAWYPLTTGQVRSALDGLGWRGLVDVAGFDGRARTFDLTAKGRALELSLLEEED